MGASSTPTRKTSTLSQVPVDACSTCEQRAAAVSYKSPLYLPCISPASPLYLRAARGRASALQCEASTPEIGQAVGWVRRARLCHECGSAPAQIGGKVEVGGERHLAHLDARRRDEALAYQGVAHLLLRLRDAVRPQWPQAAPAAAVEARRLRDGLG